VDRYAELRNLSRASLARIWRAYKGGERLDGEERRLAARMAAHPEWARYWELADDLGDAELVTEEGVSPFGRVAVEAAVEGMVDKGGDRVARRTYKELCKDGLSHEDAAAEIARAFLGVYWEVGSGKIMPEEGQRRFHAVLRRISRGEAADRIFE
jgi:Domain of unknown function (DUF1841)